MPSHRQWTKARYPKLSSKDITTRMKILTFCPTAPRLEPEVLHSLLNQGGVQFNDLMLTRDNPYNGENGRVLWNVQLAYEKMRQVVLTQGYAKVWVVESDTIPPLDALSKLLEVDAPSVSGLYALRRGSMGPNVRKPITREMFKWDELKPKWGSTITTAGGCMGCVLLDRSAIEDFCFVDEANPNAPDVPMMEYHWHKGFKQVARLDVICGHKQPSGEILWPDREQGYRIERSTAS